MAKVETMLRNKSIEPVVRLVGRGRIKKAEIDWTRIPIPELSAEERKMAKELMEDGMADTIQEAAQLMAAIDLVAEAKG